MEAEEYRQLAAVEDDMWYFRALHTHIERALVANLPAGPQRILDAGCGTGGLIRRLGARHPEWQWTGVDVSPLACQLARERGATDVREASVTALPFADGEFAAAVSADVLYHLDDDQAALREMARVIRPGGVLVLNVPAHRWLWSYHDIAVSGRRRYARNEVASKLAGAGLKLQRLTHWNSLLLPLLAVRRKLLPAPAGRSDVRLASPWLEKMLSGVAATEAAWLRTGASFPVGSSILAVATR